MATDENQHLHDVLSRLESSMKNHLEFGDSVQINRLETPSLGLTAALSGGWVMGRQGLIWGPKSAGKSSFLLQQIALAQSQGMVCAYFDVERSFDPVWAARLGVNNKELIHRDTMTVNKIVNDANAFIKAGVDVIILDSISFIMPATYTEDNGELKPFEKTGAIGGLARSLGPMLSQLVYASQESDYETLMLFVSQVRMAQKGKMHWGAQPTGGNALDHALSQGVKLFASEAKDALIKQEVVVGDRIVEKPVGRPVTWTVSKDRVGPGMGMTGEYNLFFDGDFVGIDQIGEMIELGVELGVIRKAGAWYYYGEEQVGQGANKAAANLRENEDLFAKIKEDMRGRG